jgi:flavin reductase (DIM6/NTAB) family NADH-FMN oxidoreductase RutF/DNA-binding IclR family transcriptional regulator
MSDPAAAAATRPQIDPRWYRQVLAQYPTGVCAVTARGDDGVALGMIVGSFTSVSLDPPLVAFFPDRTSSTWARLRQCRRFCINILSADQEAVCRQLASRAADKFAGLPCRPSPGGAPIIAGVVAWIDCSMHRIDEAGDHDIVLGAVEQMEIADGGLPLLFFQGGYGRFAPASLVAGDSSALVSEQFRNLDLVRPEMERLAAQCSARCTAITRVGDELVIVASAGQARHHGPTTLVGQRLPFVPAGVLFAAFLPAADSERWIAEAVPPGAQQGCRDAMAAVRSRGLSLGLEAAGPVAGGEGQSYDLAALMATLAHDPPELSPAAWSAVRLVSAPIFDAAGNVALALVLDDFCEPGAERSPNEVAALVQASALRLSQRLGHRPEG